MRSKIHGHELSILVKMHAFFFFGGGRGEEGGLLVTIFSSLTLHLTIFNNDLAIFDDRNIHTGAGKYCPKYIVKYRHLSSSGNRALVAGLFEFV